MSEENKTNSLKQPSDEVVTSFLVVYAEKTNLQAEPVLKSSASAPGGVGGSSDLFGVIFGFCCAICCSALCTSICVNPSTDGSKLLRNHAKRQKLGPLIDKIRPLLSHMDEDNPELIWSRVKGDKITSEKIRSDIDEYLRTYGFKLQDSD